MVPHKLATDGFSCSPLLSFPFYNIALGLQLGCDLLTNGCGGPSTCAYPTLLPCRANCIQKPHIAKIQSAATICGGYLGHEFPKDKTKQNKQKKVAKMYAV